MRRGTTDTVATKGVDVAPLVSSTSEGSKKVNVKVKTAECIRPVVEATSAEEQGNYTTVIIAFYTCIMLV